VPVEIAFNVAALGIFLLLNRRGAEAQRVGGMDGPVSPSAPPRLRGSLTGQHFHLYLIGYGLFRFGHEFLRATPRLGFGITGYQVAALAVVGLGVLGFIRRRGARLSHSRVG
jgi:hypothetical protein